MTRYRSGEVRIVISGGGTGGHVFPAISIANAIMRKYPMADILFVGAQKKMEMEKIPEEGYSIIGLPISGFNRKNPLKNIPLFFKLLISLNRCRHIVREFDPHVVVGVGGYASGPMLQAAADLDTPTLIQEQNSYAGITNRILGRRANIICVAYEGMERFFPADKIVLTGNPIRKNLHITNATRDKAVARHGLDPTKKTVLVLGGSLGARTINESLLSHLEDIRQSDVQFIWQTGKYYYDKVIEQISEVGEIPNIHVTDFISDMRIAYRAADMIISRAGAGSISEFQALKKAVILVPSPNVSENHQHKNAMALVENGAAILVPDTDAREKLIPLAIQAVHDDETLDSLRKHITAMARPDAADRIAELVIHLAKNKV